VKHTILFAAALLCLAVATTNAQNLRIGYVDSQKIFEGLPEAQRAQKELDAKLQVWQDSLETMSKDFQDQFEQWQSQQGMMSEDAKKTRQQELLKMQNDLQEYRTRKFGQQGEAAVLRAKVLQPLQDKVLKAIEDVAKDEKLSFVFDKIQDASILLFADAKFDFTFKVLDKLKRGSN
jgi:outer membrane protein